jgi:YfiH family protein
MNDLGIGFDGDEFTVLFGNRHFLLSDFSEHFPEWTPITLHQVHGNSVVEQHALGKKELEADGHFTSKPNLALVIKTADCLPVFIWNRKTKVISGVHAGWRGVENGIITKAIEKISSADERKDLEIWIGPHITEISFEVGSDVLEQFQASLPKDFSFYEKRKDKFYIDLQKIAFHQLERLGVSKQQVHTLNIDTKTDQDFYSHRRKAGEGRNYSFIVKK